VGREVCITLRLIRSTLKCCIVVIYIYIYLKFGQSLHLFFVQNPRVVAHVKSH
jgi:hypothetical protein